MSEADRSPAGLIGALIAATVIVVAALVFGVNQFFDFSVESEILRKVLALESTTLRKQRADEETRLSHYQWVSQKAGVVRIPADRATELILREAEMAKEQAK